MAKKMDDRRKWFERCAQKTEYRFFYFENGHPKCTEWMSMTEAGFRHRSLQDRGCDITRVDKQTRQDAWEDFQGNSQVTN